MVTADELGDERPNVLEHAQDSGPDAEVGGTSRGFCFICAVDAEELCAFAGNAHHVFAVVRGRDEVSVGDSAVQCSETHRLAGEQTTLAHEPFDICPPVHNSTV